MDLYIDTAKINQTTIKIIDNGVETLVKNLEGVGSDTLLPHLTAEFKEFDPKKIKRIFVNSGPGSFTGTRVGVSVANALSFSLNIPVNNLKNRAYAKVKYEKSKFS